MGQAGGACNKCSDVSLNSKNAPTKGLDDTSSEGEGAGDEEPEEEEPEENEEEELEKERKNAAEVLSQGLKRGKTGAFSEAIEHATQLGLDEDKILMAEKKLEDHKAVRRKEAFEAELADFLNTEDANDTAQCEEKLAQGSEYGVSEKALQPLKERIVELQQMEPLRPDEVDLTKQFLELCTRRFVASCVKGRDLHWVDLDSGSKEKSVAKMDLTLKNFTVEGPPNGNLACKVADVTAKRAAEVAEVTSKSGFDKLGDAEREKAVVLQLDGKDLGPWCFIEDSKLKQDEFLCGFHVLCGKQLPPAPSREESASKAAAKPKKEGNENNEAEEVLEETEEAVEEAEADNEALRDAGNAEEAPENPSPRKSTESKDGAKKKGGKDKKDKKDKKEKPPPPPEEELEEAEEEGSEAEE